MDSRPCALYSAISEDLKDVSCFGPVGPHELPPDASYQQAAASLLLRSILKKWTPSNQDKADSFAIEKFLTQNKKCEDWTYSGSEMIDEWIDGEFRNATHNFFETSTGNILFDYEDILESSRVGPGSSIGANGFSHYAKLAASVVTTTSSDLYYMYRRFTGKNPTTERMEFIRLNKFGRYREVNSSSMSLVPKTEDISRLICTEPSLNMMFQLGVGAILERRLRSYFGIDLSTRPDVNKALARWGSIDQSFSTIDLESASDSVSLKFAKWALPDWVFETLMELRSPNTTIRGQSHALNMVSTMGNGFTFPLQTIIFSCLVESIYRVKGIPFSKGVTNWSCFGDDIIVRSDCYDLVARTLARYGFTVNRLKSYSVGPFRESCGADWFNGQPIRGVYVKRLDSAQDISVAINLLNEWTSYTGIILRNAVKVLRSWLRTEMYIPYFENHDAGLKVPALFFDSRIKRNRNGTLVYRAYRSKPIGYTILEDRLVGPRRCKQLFWNPDGLLESFLRGEIRNGRLLVRNDWVRYTVRLVQSPFWDYVQPGTTVNGYRVSWKRWENAVLFNMSNPA